MALTEDQKNEVQLMINNSITVYDAKQELRHSQNLKQFEEVKTAIATNQGAKSYKEFILPIILTALLVILGILDLVFKK